MALKARSFEKEVVEESKREVEEVIVDNKKEKEFVFVKDEHGRMALKIKR